MGIEGEKVEEEAGTQLDHIERGGVYQTHGLATLEMIDYGKWRQNRIRSRCLWQTERETVSSVKRASNCLG